jgi:hypothetical protein
VREPGQSRDRQIELTYPGNDAERLLAAELRRLRRRAGMRCTGVTKVEPDGDMDKAS